ncbi:hypothetical protein BDZ91DRAFT_190466 [Kalaharituber pfeilii]|nr:hypothetical protein BDZ91DRAFT_190466 [Kalaharituber pfeilii]
MVMDRARINGWSDGHGRSHRNYLRHVLLAFFPPSFSFSYPFPFEFFFGFTEHNFLTFHMMGLFFSPLHPFAWLHIYFTNLYFLYLCFRFYFTVWE